MSIHAVENNNAVCPCPCHINGVCFIKTSVPPQLCCDCAKYNIDKKNGFMYAEKNNDETLKGNLWHLVKRIEKLEQENETRKNTIGCLDQAYDDACRELEKEIERLKDSHQEEIKSNNVFNERLKKLESLIDIKKMEQIILDGAMLHATILKYEVRMKKLESQPENKKPHCCPVCEGKGGTVIGGVIDEECRACNGKCIVWG